MAVATAACGGPSATKTREYPAPSGDRALVAPLKNDSGPEILSWVDGQPIADWPAEIARRDRAIEGYLSDSDPVRSETYGFRRGQTPQLAWNWFRDNPVGFNGVPLVLLKTILDLDPNHPQPALRALARIWKHEAVIPGEAERLAPRGRSITSASSPIRPTTRRGGAPGQRAAVSAPLRLRLREPAHVRAAFRQRNGGRRWTTAGAARLQNTSLLIAKVRTAEVEDNWERDRPGFGSPGRWTACSCRARPVTSAA
jgi:hypothetical protein